MIQRQSVGREIAVLITAASLGGIAAAIFAPLLSRMFASMSARDIAVAIGAGVTSAVHSGLVHRHGWRSMLITLVLSVPIVYVVMIAIHRLFGM